MIWFKREEIKRCEGTRDYLLRWRLASCRGWGLYLHKFLASDGEDLHDHPWWYVSLILWRGYWEVSEVNEVIFLVDHNGSPLPIVRKVKVARRFWPGQLLFRPATWTHQIQLVEDRPAWTLVLRGPVSRKWGFWLAGRWKGWKDYKEEGC